MNEMINKIGKRLVTQMRAVNTFGNELVYDNNLRTNPFRSELAGMQNLLKAMDIEFDFEYNEDVTEFTAVILMGKRFTV